MIKILYLFLFLISISGCSFNKNSKFWTNTEIVKNNKEKIIYKEIFPEEEALKKSLTIGCKGIHKNKDKWLPCSNEKELHKYLRK